MTNQAYVQISLPIQEEQFDLAIGLLTQIGFESFLEENDTLLAYLPEESWSNDIQAKVDTVLFQLIGKSKKVKIETINPQNWNEEWEASLQPIAISDEIIIIQHGKPYPKKEGQIVVEINPKMSFGTGYHETTRLMIKQMIDFIQPSDFIFDIGTGTGVLAITARKLGNQMPIYACDNDEWSISNANENIQVNSCNNIKVFHLDALHGLDKVLSQNQFSLILANINRAIHEKIFPVISKASPHAKLLISGLLKYDLEWLQNSIQAIDYKLDKLTEEGEWICALLSGHKQ